jgi:hypothetical protein
LGVLQVEIVEGPGGDELAGERGLATLPRADEGNDAAAPQSGADELDVGKADDHGENYIP